VANFDPSVEAATRTRLRRSTSGLAAALNVHRVRKRVRKRVRMLLYVCKGVFDKNACVRVL
jgi:hypothetical protein